MEKQTDKEIAKPPVLFKETQVLLKDLQSILDGTLICYWNSNNGSVCGTDSLAIYEALKNKPKKSKIYFFIKSDGGSGIAALKIINVLRQYCKRLIALVPLNCASAATMLALGADEIHMGPLSYLTPVDTSITHDLSPVDVTNDLVSVSMDELNRVLKLWNNHTTGNLESPYKNLYSYIHPLVFGAVDRASSLSLKLCQELLGYHMKDKETIERISAMLNFEYPAHGYPILSAKALELGLPVKPMNSAVSEKLLELNLKYAEMGQRALTDYDEKNYHNNAINNIIEIEDKQIYYQIDKDWFYRSEERRYIALNDNSSWRKNEMVNGEIINSVYHLW
jgi:hypothetical protein